MTQSKNKKEERFAEIASTALSRWAAALAVAGVARGLVRY
jgi:hypothetical protein